MALDDLAAAVEQLRHSSSAKRRSAAKKLRKLGDPAAGGALLAALQAEVLDERTWETQYQLIMATAESRHVPAEAFLRQLASRTFEATMLYVALGDALVRLASPPARMGQVAVEMTRTGNRELADGAGRALAMLRVVPEADVIESLLRHAEQGDLHETQGINLRFWVAAACPGWLDRSPAVHGFLQRCLESRNQQVQRAAGLALEGEYARWSPL
jgi:hypothetical protein